MKVKSLIVHMIPKLFQDGRDGLVMTLETDHGTIGAEHIWNNPFGIYASESNERDAKEVAEMLRVFASAIDTAADRAKPPDDRPTSETADCRG